MTDITYNPEALREVRKAHKEYFEVAFDLFKMPGVHPRCIKEKLMARPIMGGITPEELKAMEERVRKEGAIH